MFNVNTVNYRKYEVIKMSRVTHYYVALGAAVGKAFSDGMKLK